MLNRALEVLEKHAGLRISYLHFARSTPGRRVIYFLHISKAAGSQIKKVIPRINAGQKDVQIRGVRHHIGLCDLPQNAEFFFSVRDPIARFRSGFYSRKRMGHSHPSFPWLPQEEQVFAKFEHANDLAEALFTEGPRGRDAICAIKTIKHTADNQFDWFSKAAFLFDQRPPVWIIRQEHFDADFDIFCQRAGITARPSTDRGSHGANRGSYDDTPALSDLAKANLRRWYVQDFAFQEAIENWMEREQARP